MSKRGYITRGEIAAKLRFLHVRCDRCNRWGRYSTVRLVKEYGADASIEQFQNDITRLRSPRRSEDRARLGLRADVPETFEDHIISDQSARRLMLRLLRIFLILSISPLWIALSSCGAGMYLTKPHTTMKDYVDDKADCEAIAPQMEMPSTESTGDRKTPLGFRFMDPRVYECMLEKGWRHV